MKSIKVITSFLVVLFLSFSAYGQVPLEVEVNVLPPYPTEYSVWASEAESFTVFVMNNSDTEFNFFIRVELKGTTLGGEEVFIRILEDYVPSQGFTLGSGEGTMLSSSEIFDAYSNFTPGQDIETSPSIDTDNINGELPAGNYQICAQLIEFKDDFDMGDQGLAFLSPLNCSDSFIAGQASIELIGPDPSLQLNTDFSNVFQWIATGINPSDIGEYGYTLKIYEIDSLQAAEESVYDLVEEGFAEVFFTSEEVNEDLYVHDPTLGSFPMQADRVYAAQVTVTDPDDILFENNFKSNVLVFGLDDFDIDIPLSDEELTENQVDCFENCNYVLEGNTTPLTDANPEAIEVGNFTMTDIEITNHNTDNNKYSVL